MTDILLPIRTQNSEQIRRLTADLATAHASGLDLGSRAPHIQDSGRRLQQLCREFETMIVALDQSLIEPTFHEQGTHEVLMDLIAVARKLAISAQRFEGMPDGA